MKSAIEHYTTSVMNDLQTIEQSLRLLLIFQLLIAQALLRVAIYYDYEVTA